MIVQHICIFSQKFFKFWFVENQSKSSFMVVIYLKGKIKKRRLCRNYRSRRNVFCQKNTPFYVVLCIICAFPFYEYVYILFVDLTPGIFK